MILLGLSLLIIISPLGFIALLRRRVVGKVFAALLLALSLASVSFGALFTTNFNPTDTKTGFSLAPSLQSGALK